MISAWLCLLVCLGVQYAQGDVLDSLRTQIPDSYSFTNPVEVSPRNAGKVVIFSLWNVTANGLSTIDWVKPPVVSKNVRGDASDYKFDVTIFFKKLNFEGTFAPMVIGRDVLTPAPVSIDWGSNRFSIQGEVTKTAEGKCEAVITNINVDELSDPRISFTYDKPSLIARASDIHLIKSVLTPNIKKPLREVVMFELEKKPIKQLISDNICLGFPN